jgi:hypothetical protein
MVLEASAGKPKPKIEYKRRPNREIPPSSIVRLAPSLNRFLGGLPDSAPITAIARIDSDSDDRRHVPVELVGDFWREVGATDLQLARIRKLFRTLHFNAPNINTLGRIREACKSVQPGQSGRIARTKGMEDTSELFLAIAVEKK